MDAATDGIRKVLVAERGEAAARISRTCKRIGLESVALQGEDETEGVHLEACDETRAVPARGREATPDEVVEAARASGADAVHPGYAAPWRLHELACAVEDAGLVWLGAPAEVLRGLATRQGPRAIAERVDVRTVPASPDPLDDPEAIRETAHRVGFPVLLKAPRPGTGIAPFAASDPDALDQAMDACRRACEQELGDPRLVLEHRLDRPRLIEVTLFGDTHGATAVLGDRERTLWREGSVLLEESPSSALVTRRDGEAIRGALYDAAIRIAREAGFLDIGSARFLFDVEGRTWFLGLEPGLPVGHSMTEMLTGIDVVELQLRAAEGQAVAHELQRIEGSGHSFCARVRAAKAARGKDVRELRWPSAPQGRVRVDPSVTPGSTVRREGDPLLLKITTYGAIRHAAFLTLDRFVAATTVQPVETDTPLLRQALADEAFRAGQYDTSFAVRLTGA